jgi:hypothetical protein
MHLATFCRKYTSTLHTIVSSSGNMPDKVYNFSATFAFNEEDEFGSVRLLQPSFDLYLSDVLH